MTIDQPRSPEDAYNYILELSLDLEKVTSKMDSKDLRGIFIESVGSEIFFVPEALIDREVSALDQDLSEKVELEAELKPNLEKIVELFEEASKFKELPILNGDLRDRLNDSEFDGYADKAIERFQKIINEIGEKYSKKEELNETKQKIKEFSSKLLNNLDKAKKKEISSEYKKQIASCNRRYDKLVEAGANLIMADSVNSSEMSNHLKALQDLRRDVFDVIEMIKSACQQDKVYTSNFESLESLESIVNDLDDEITASKKTYEKVKGKEITERFQEEIDECDSQYFNLFKESSNLEKSEDVFAISRHIDELGACRVKGNEILSRVESECQNAGIENIVYFDPTDRLKSILEGIDNIIPKLEKIKDSLIDKSQPMVGEAEQDILTKQKDIVEQFEKKVDEYENEYLELFKVTPELEDLSNLKGLFNHLDELNNLYDKGSKILKKFEAACQKAGIDKVSNSEIVDRLQNIIKHVEDDISEFKGASGNLIDDSESEVSQNIESDISEIEELFISYEDITEQFQEDVDEYESKYFKFFNEGPAVKDSLDLSAITDHLDELETLQINVNKVLDDIKSACKKAGLDKFADLDLVDRLENILQNIENDISEFREVEERLLPAEGVSKIIERFQENVDEHDKHYFKLFTLGPEIKNSANVSAVTKHLDELERLDVQGKKILKKIVSECRKAGLDNVADLDLVDRLESNIKNIEENISAFRATEQLLLTCCQSGIPKSNEEAVSILEKLKNTGLKKAFLVTPNEKGFNLYVLEGKKIDIKNLTIEDDGRFVSGDDEFENFDMMVKELGDFGLNALVDYQKKNMESILGKTTSYNDVDNAKEAFVRINPSDAKTNTFFVWKDPDGKDHILSYKFKTQEPIDYLIDFEKEPGKIFLRVNNEYGIETDYDDLNAVKESLGKPLHELESAISTHNHLLNEALKKDTYSYEDLSKLGIVVDTNDFSVLKSIAERFHLDKPHYMFLADNEIPANLTMFSLTPEDIQIERVLVDKNGRITLQEVDENGKVLNDKEFKFPGGIEFFKTLITSGYFGSLKELIETKRESFDTQLGKMKNDLLKVQEEVKRLVVTKSFTEGKQKAISAQLEQFKGEAKKLYMNFGVKVQDSEILQEIEKEIKTIDLRKYIEIFSESFKKIVKEAETYEDLDKAFFDFKKVLARASDKSAYNMSNEELFDITKEYTEIQSQRAKELFPHYIEQIPNLQREWLKTTSELSVLEKRQRELQSMLKMVKLYESDEKVSAAIESLTYVDGCLIDMMKSLKPQEIENPHRALIVLEDGAVSNVFEAPVGEHQMVVADSVSKAYESIMRAQGASLATVAGFVLTSSIVSGISQYTSPAVAVVMEPCLYLGSYLLLNRYLLSKSSEEALPQDAQVFNQEQLSSEPLPVVSREEGISPLKFVDNMCGTKFSEGSLKNKINGVLPSVLTGDVKSEEQGVSTVGKVAEVATRAISAIQSTARQGMQKIFRAFW